MFITKIEYILFSDKLIKKGFFSFPFYILTVVLLEKPVLPTENMIMKFR